MKNRCAWLGILVPAFISIAHAASTATLTGTVSDQSGRSVPSVTVLATRTESNSQISTTTNEAGIYAFPDLQIGTYKIQVSRDGFKMFVRSGIELHVQDEIALNVSLELGSVAESVSVDAAAPLVQTTGMGVSTVIDRKFVEDLPLNGRSFQTLFQLTPGIVIAPASATGPGQFSVNGQRTNANYLSVDGVSANVGIGAGGVPGPGTAGAQMATSILGGTNNLVSVDALEEFRIQTSSFAPEYGRTPGGQVSIVTRSGTNQFHGTAFDYLRNDKLDANNWFANQAGQPKPPERQNDFGGVLGGPLLSDRSFFFFSYEGLRLRQPQTIAGSYVPSLASRQSAPAALQPFLNAYPLPNGPDLPGGFAQENASFSNPSTLDSTGIRMDQRLGKSWSVFGRFSDSPSSLQQRAGSNSLNTITQGTLGTRTITAGAIWVVSPSISNDAHFNFSTTEGTQGFVTDNFGGATPLPSALTCPFSGSPVNGCELYMTLSQANSTLVTGPSADNRLRQVNLIDSVAWSRGGHRFAAGVDLRWLHTVLLPADGLTTIFTAVGPAPSTGTLLSGIPSISASSVLAPNSELNYSNVSIYAQDIWQVTKRLNLTYGLRWDINPAPSGPTAWSVTNVDNQSQLALSQVGAALWSTPYNNIAPRLGFAYNAHTKQGYETVVRGGAGIFYDLVSGLLSSELLKGPNSGSVLYSGVSFPFSGLPLVSFPTKPPYSSFTAADPNLGTPTVYEWNIGVQQGLGTARSLSINYLGSRDIHMVRQENYQSPNSTFSGSVSLIRTNADGRYNALQVQYQQRLSHSIQVLGNYTFSHSTDDASTDSASVPPSLRLAPQTDLGPSDFDVRHSVSAAVTYSLPGPRTGIASVILGGWAADGMFVGRTAFPLNVTFTRNLGYGSFAYRPDLVAGVPLYISDSNVAGGSRLNPAAFTAPTDLRQGNLGRNALLGFGMSQLNGAVHKSFRLTEKTTLQARVEFFNLLNHPNFADPSPSLGSVNTAGVLTRLGTFGFSRSMLNQGLGSGGTSAGFLPLYQMGGPRSLQLSLKFIF